MSVEQPRVLILGMYCLPGTEAGGVRIHALASHLARLGASVTLITGEPDASIEGVDVRVVPLKYIGARVKSAIGASGGESLQGRVKRLAGPAVAGAVAHLARIAKSAVMHPDEFASWGKAVDKLVGAGGWSPGDFDAIISSGPPVTVHVVAARTQRALGIPVFIMDHRDLWTDNPYYPHGPIRHALDVRRQRRLFSRPDAHVVVTEALKRQLEASAPGMRIEVIRNGLDLSQLSPTPAPSRENLTIVHAGTLISGKRDLRPLLGAMRAIADCDEEIGSLPHLDLYGRPDVLANQSIADLDLAEMVTVHGEVHRSAAQAAIASCDVALIVMWPPDVYAVPSKLYEYIALNRAVLVVGAAVDSEIRAFAEDVEGVYFANTAGEVADVLRTLHRAKLTLGGLEYTRYGLKPALSHDRMVGKFAQLIRDLTLCVSPTVKVLR